jgi:hypothetical protein
MGLLLYGATGWIDAAMANNGFILRLAVVISAILVAAIVYFGVLIISGGLVLAELKSKFFRTKN